MLHLTLPIFYIVACFFSFEFFIVVGKPLQGHVTLYPATDELESIYDMYYIKPFVVLYFFPSFELDDILLLCMPLAGSAASIILLAAILQKP